MYVAPLTVKDLGNLLRKINPLHMKQWSPETLENVPEDSQLEGGEAGVGILFSTPGSAHTTGCLLRDGCPVVGQVMMNISMLHMEMISAMPAT